MKFAARTIVALGLIAPSLQPSADLLKRVDSDSASVATIVDLSAPRLPTGIKGNGLLGIEGNGVIQRRDNGELVLNDSLYAVGPGCMTSMVAAEVASTRTRTWPGPTA